MLLQGIYAIVHRFVASVPHGFDNLATGNQTQTNCTTMATPLSTTTRSQKHQQWWPTYHLHSVFRNILAKTSLQTTLYALKWFFMTSK